MKLHLVLTLFAFVGGAANGQTDNLFASAHSQFRLVYKLNGKEARKHSVDEYNKLLGKKPYDTLPLDSSVEEYLKTLPNGHFLLTYAWHEKIITEYHQVTPYELRRLQDGKNTRLLVYNQNGQLDSTLQVKHGKRGIDYNAAHACYYHKKNLKNETFSVDNDKDTFYFTNIGSHGWRLPKDHNSFRKGIRQAWNQTFAKPRLAGWSNYGYLATNQPNYRVGDTLKIKAYALKRNGKPYDKELTLGISENYYTYKKLVNVTLTPEKPGVYTYEIVIPDSFKIDQRYQIYLTNENRSFLTRRISVRNGIKVEDYQLDEAQITITPAKPKFYLNDTVKLKIEATDANGLPMRNASAQIEVRHQSSHKMYTGCATVPFKLLETDMDLEPDGTTDFILPDSILNKGLAQQIQLNFIVNTASNETHEFTKYIDYDPVKEPKSLQNLEVKDLSTQVEIEGAEDGFEVQWLKQNDVLTSLKPETNKVYILESASHLRVINPNNDSLTVDLGRWGGKVFLGHSRTTDSVSFSCLNPRNLKVHYQLYKGEWLLESGIITENRRWKLAADNTLPYTLKIEYVWAGVGQSLTEKAFLAENQLTVKVAQPEKIFPGQKPKIKVEVLDHEINPVADADVLAFGLNSTFQENNVPNIPAYKTKRNAIRLASQKSIAPLTGHQRHIHITAEHLPIFKLKDQRYYQLIRSQKAVVNYAHDSVFTTQFTPHVFENNQLQQVQMVFVDGVPKYWNKSSPYFSIAVKPGKHDVVIRLRKKEIRLKEVEFQDLKKHELCLNLDIKTDKLTQKRKRKRLTRKERKALESCLLLVLNAPYDLLLEQESFRTIANRYSYQFIGPFLPNDTVDVSSSEGEKIRIAAGSGKAKTFQSSTTHYRKENLIAYGNGRRISKRLIRHFREQHYDGKPSVFYQFLHDSVAFSSRSTTTVKIKEPFEFGSGKLVLFIRKGFLVNKRICQENGKCSSYGQNNIVMGDIDFEQLDPGFYNAELKFRETSYKFSYVEIKEESVTYIDASKNCPNVEIEHSSNGKASISGQFFDIETGTSKDISKRVRLSVNGINRSRTFITTLGPNEFVFFNLPPGRYFVKNIYGVSNFAYIKTPSGNLGHIFIKPSEINRNYGLMGITRSSDRSLFSRRTKPSPDLIPRFSGGYMEGNAISRERSIKSNMVEVLGGVTSTDGATPTLYGDFSGYDKVLMDSIAEMPNGPLLIHDVNSYPQTSNPKIRSNFADVAFWFPSLTTNQQGKVSFKPTFPDDITNWETHYLVMGNKKSGHYQGSIKAYLPLSANLRTPRFLIEGDQTHVSAQDLNYTGDSLKVIPSFMVNDLPGGVEPYFLKESHLHHHKVIANADTMKVTYRLETDYDFFDGEERDIPVFKKGLEQKVGHFLVLKHDTTLTLSFKPEMGSITLYAAPDPTAELMKSLEALRNYVHACNEQLASKLLGLLFEEELKGKDSKGLRALAIKRKISRLDKNYQKAKGWSWFNNSGNYNVWVSNHVVQTLIVAKAKGYESKTLAYALDMMKKEFYAAENKGKHLSWLYLLSEANAVFDYRNAINLVSKKKLSGYQKVQLSRIRQRQNVDFDLKAFLNGAKQTATGMMYWGDEDAAFYYSALPTTVVAFDVLKDAKRDAELEKTALWLLYQKRNGAWANTLHTSQTLMRLIPYFQFSKKGLKGKSLVEYQSANGEWEALTQKTILDAQTTVNIRKLGKTPLFFTAYQSFWNAAPKAKTDIAHFTLDFKNKEASLQSLKAGQPVQLKVNVNVHKAAEYCMVSIPIPAGCSYGKKLFNRSWGSSEVHREYFKNRVVIYYESLPVGKYDVLINLEPRFKGQYHLNPTQLELMYFPTLSANNESRVMKIE